MGHLLLIRGLPGTGKSTLGRKLARVSSGQCLHVETDQYFVDDDGVYNFDASKLNAAHAWCRDIVKSTMHNGMIPVIIVTNTFTRNWEIQPYIDLAKDYNFTYSVVDMAQDHLSNEALANRNSHDVPLEAIERMRNRWEKFCE